MATQSTTEGQDMASKGRPDFTVEMIKSQMGTREKIDKLVKLYEAREKGVRVPRFLVIDRAITKLLAAEERKDGD